MSRELLRRGFRFVGPTICYALMQATGMVNDHVARVRGRGGHPGGGGLTRRPVGQQRRTRRPVGQQHPAPGRAAPAGSAAPCGGTG